MSETSVTPTSSGTTGFEIPVRLLSIAAGVVLLAILGATALSVGVWLNEGRPTVVASFGRGPGPGGARPGVGQPPPQGGQPNGGNVPGRGGPGQQQGQQGQQGQRGGFPGGQQPNQAPQGQQGGLPGAGATIPGLTAAPDLTGVVVRAGGGGVAVQTRQGPVQVLITSDTRIFRRDGSTGSSSDIGNGATVAVVMVANAPTPTAAEIAIVATGR